MRNPFGLTTLFTSLVATVALTFAQDNQADTEAVIHNIDTHG